MSIFKKILTLLVVPGFFVSDASSQEPYPIETFAKGSAIRQVTLSPDGSRMALLRTTGRKRRPVLEIYNTNDLSEQPFRVNASKMDVITYNWVSNSNLVLGLRQQVRDKIEGFNRGVFEFKIAKLDIEKEKLQEFRDSGLQIVNPLPKQKEKVLVSLKPNGWESTDPYSYYVFDLKTGRKKLKIRGTRYYGGYRFDIDGNPTFARSFDRKNDYFTYFIRDNEKKEWKEIFKVHEDSFEDFRVEGFDPLDKSKLIVSAHNGKNTRGLWTFDYESSKFGEMLYHRKDVDVVGVRRHSDSLKSDEIIGVVYGKDKYRVEYFDPSEKALYDQLYDLTPNAYSIRVTSRSKDGQSITFVNNGPRDPGTHYMIRKGKVAKIGSQRPDLKPENLAEVKHIKYKARDGMKLYAYVTIPNGKGPFPAVVMPHGGPFVQEVVGFDPWGQLLANNGYVVIQPQYRGSQGYGLEYYKSAFTPKGEGGFKMQDDKDDAALHLVKEGLIDKDRIAMFGWSYGGYAALVAASREEQIYQCSIAGAAVSDNKYQLDFYVDRLRGAQEAEQKTFWTDSISPIKEVAKVNVPLLMIHGSVDQRVPPQHAYRYLDEAKKTKQKVEYVELEDADHFSNTLNFNHRKTLYGSLVNFLKNDCGPGGL